MSYAVVTPARNEAESLPRLADSLLTQSLSPSRWVVVENGSTDSTPQTLDALRGTVPFLVAVSLPRDEVRAYAGHVGRALQAAIPHITPLPEIVVSVDADVTFPTDHFERLLERFAGDETLGIASGTCLEEVDGEWKERHVTGDHVWGAARAYRREVIPVVMPLENQMGWDGIDQIKANVAGWTTATFKDIPFFHHRPEGARKGGSFAVRTRQGQAAYYMGYRPSYLVLRAMFATRNDLGALGLVWGYLRSLASQAPRCADPFVRAHLRETQRLRLVGKRLKEALGRR